MSQTQTLVEDKRSGILYREGTFDEWILRESRGYFPIFFNERDTILDIGGHIGCFAARCKSENLAMNVISIEAEKSNFDVLVENAQKFGFEAHHNAVCNDENHLTPIPIYVNTLKNNALHSTLPTRGRPHQLVMGYSFNQLLYRYNPNIIKCDIEGGEYDLPWTSLSQWSSVRIVIMELHLTRKGFRERAKEMLWVFDSMGFKRYGKEPVIGEKNWTTLVRWWR
jgi:FkbM family methyltransferase